jgi:fructose-bisphosphate aldolase class I
MTTATAWATGTSLNELDHSYLIATANALVAADKGLLAADESIPTCNKRFARLGIDQTEHFRRAYRDMIITTPGLADSISGVILCDETIRQHLTGGDSFAAALAAAGMVPGIKVDRGAHPLAGHPGEKVTEGLDGLRERLVQYASMGARFAKWRAVFTIGQTIPSQGCVHANAHALARYAALCQEAGLVPVVEPEVLMAGVHTADRCGAVTETVLREVFSALHDQGVLLEGMLLKTNMVLAGTTCPIQPSPEEDAQATIACLRRSVPAAVAGVVFLSGGQSGDLATARLNAITTVGESALPWPVGFSYGRAIQQPALSLWDGQPSNVPAAQRAIAGRARNNHDARRGRYTPTAALTPS